MPKFTYDDAVRIRAEYLELQRQLPEILLEASEKYSIVSIAKNLKYSRVHIHTIINRAK